MGTARLTIALAKITENARKTVEICRRFGLEVVGVTKNQQTAKRAKALLGQARKAAPAKK